MTETLNIIIPMDFGSLMMWTFAWAAISGWLGYTTGKINGRSEEREAERKAGGEI